MTWLQSYVSGDKQKTFCIYDGPNPEAIRRTATQNGLPVDHITEVRVLDPYFLPVTVRRRGIGRSGAASLTAEVDVV